MRLIDWLQPRDRRAAARKVTIMASVAGGIVLIEALVRLGAGRPADLVLPVAVALVLLAIAGAFVPIRRNPSGPGRRLLWAAVPLVAVVLITALDLATGDAGSTGLFCFVFPALYAASQLRRPGMVLMSGLVLAACVVVVFTLLPPLEAVVTTVYMAGIGLTATILLFQSVERTARLVGRLEQLAAVDPLTGLVTRRVLDEATRTALTRSPDVGTGLLILDIDHFKQINDQHGHPAGDEVLVRLADTLTRHCRRTDVISRLGGDEVAILFPGIRTADLTDRIAAIGAAVRGLPVPLPDGTEVRLSVSGGAAHAPSHAGDHRSLYTAADIALYEAKRAGRDRIVVSAGAASVTVDAASRPDPQAVPTGSDTDHQPV